MKIIYAGALRRSAESRGPRICERLWAVGVPRAGWMDGQKGTPVGGTNSRPNDPHPRKRENKGWFTLLAPHSCSMTFRYPIEKQRKVKQADHINDQTPLIAQVLCRSKKEQGISAAYSLTCGFKFHTGLIRPKSEKKHVRKKTYVFLTWFFCLKSVSGCRCFK